MVVFADMSKLSYKTVLVTGSAGFIGFHLSKKLLEQGIRVIGVDCLNHYYDVKMKEKRNAILKKSKEYSFYKVDISDYKKINSVIQRTKPDVIVHFAAQAGVRYSLKNPWSYADSNYLGTLNIFESAKNNSIKKVIYASSASVYGANKKTPFSEEHRVDHPLSIYGASKRANELLAHSYFHLYGIESAGIRFFTVYGKYGRPDLALFKFAKSILNNKEISVYNRGKMTRTFTHVDDAIAGVHAILIKKKLGCEIYNIGGGETVELIQFVKMIEKRLDKKARIKYLPIQAGDVPNASPDLTKSNTELGYMPKVTIEQGINDFIEWFVQNKDWVTKLKDAE